MFFNRKKRIEYSEEYVSRRETCLICGYYYDKNDFHYKDIKNICASCNSKVQDAHEIFSEELQIDEYEYDKKEQRKKHHVPVCKTKRNTQQT